MKKEYVTPEVLPIALYPADGVLNNASNEGYGTDPFDPGFAPMPDIF